MISSKANNKVRIVIDTNLWISMLIGKQVALLQGVIKSHPIEIMSSPHLLEEIQTVVSRPKFRTYFPERVAKDLIKWLQDNTTSVVLEQIPARCRDPKDDYLLELAVRTQAIYLVSGDKDLLELGQIEGCRIMTLRQFILDIQTKE